MNMAAHTTPAEASTSRPVLLSAIKMPSAAALGFKRAGTRIKHIDDSGWTNGSLLDLLNTPPVVAQAFEKHLQEAGTLNSPNRDGVVKNVVATAMTGDAVLTPAAWVRGLRAPDRADGKQSNIESILLTAASENIFLSADSVSFAYFVKVYKGCEFLGSNSGASVLVKHKGEPVGVMAVTRIEAAEANQFTA